MSSDNWNDRYLMGEHKFLLCNASSGDFILAVITARTIAQDVGRPFWVYQGEFFWAGDEKPGEKYKLIALVHPDRRVEWKNGLENLHDQV